jgi:hypothetical protein
MNGGPPVTQAPFPGPGQDGGEEPPLPGGPVRDDDALMARWESDIRAGREQVPEPWSSPACTVSLGEAADVDLAEFSGAVFTEDRAGDAMAPGPVLAALTEQAAGDVAALTDDELVGAAAAARRLAARAEYLELTAVAEFGRRRDAACEASKAAGARPGRRDGEFAGEELAYSQVSSADQACDKLAFAAALAARLPDTFARLGAGRLDRYRALLIHRATACLTDAQAAEADTILAAAAPGLTYGQLRAKAARLEMRLDPEGVKRRKDEAAARHRRVEARREDSGNMAFGGRELTVEEALAAKAAIETDAVALRNAGMDGSLRQLRVLAYLDRLQGLNPLHRITARAGHPDPGGNPAGGEDEDEGRPGGFGGGPQGPGTPAGGLAPLPALTTLVVSAGTLLGWSDAPGEVGGWGPVDADDVRCLVQAASAHPRSRWCVTVSGPDGTAIGHGCARGQHPWTPEPGPGASPGHGPHRRPGSRDGPAQLADLLRRLNITVRPIAKGSCDHRHHEDRYTPSRRLKHLIRARTARCGAPGCGARAINCDLDHTLAYPAGITCECDLGPFCRRHHRVKQAPGWRVDQPEPGVIRWTTPAGRHYTTRPTVYET